MRNDDDRRCRGSRSAEDDTVGDFLDRRRSRDRDYEEFLESYQGRSADVDDGYIGSRQGSAARRVISEGRVTGSGHQGSQSRSGTQNGYTDSNNGSGYNRNEPPERRRVSPVAEKSYTNSNNRKEYNRDKDDRSGKKKPRRILRTACLLVLVLLALYYILMGILTADIVRVDVDTSQAVAPAQEVSEIDVKGNTLLVRNVLLLGIDDDGSSGSRSDTMMIASVNMARGSVSLCSILRDNYVYIPGKSERNRINSAYAFGGAELSLRTVEANFRLDIDDYVSVDMEAMRHIVDAIGGVKITITEAEAGQINRYSWSKSPDVSAGEMILDGRQAVCYAQIRKIDSDFGRTNRQRVLIGAIIAQCRTLSLGQLVALVDTVSPYLTTNMSSAQIATLALQVLPALGGEFGQMSIPAEGTYTSENIRGMDVLVGDLAENTRQLHDFLYN